MSTHTAIASTAAHHRASIPAGNAAAIVRRQWRYATDIWFDLYVTERGEVTVDLLYVADCDGRALWYDPTNPEAEETAGEHARRLDPQPLPANVRTRLAAALAAAALAAPGYFPHAGGEHLRGRNGTHTLDVRTLISPLRLRVLRAAAEHGAAGWAATPGVGEHNAARYIWETLGDDVSDRAECDWIDRYLKERPEVFQLPANPAGTWRTQRLELSALADLDAMAAYKAGDYPTALAALEEAEALHPDPRNQWDHARAMLTGLIADNPPTPAVPEPTYTVVLPGVLADHVKEGIEQDGGPAWEAFKSAPVVGCGNGHFLRITGTEYDLDAVSVRAKALLNAAGSGEVKESEIRAAQMWLTRVARATASDRS